MNGLTMAVQMIAALSILIVLHELGHYVAARAFGIKVEKFYLFFDAWGIKLFKFKKGDCEYGIGWLPLGGYVKISGMIDESMDKEQMAQPAQPWEFRSKPAWQRLIVMLAGVFVNVVLGILIFWMISYKTGEQYLPNSELKYGIHSLELGQELGLETGDKIKAINGTPVVKFDDVLSPKVMFGNSVLTIIRDGKELDITVPPDFLNKAADIGPGNFIMPRFEYSIDSVVKGSPADAAGLQKSDRILAINGQSTVFVDQLNSALKGQEGNIVQLNVLRATDTLALSATLGDNATLGILMQRERLNTKTIEYGFFEALPIGVKKAYNTIVLQVRSFAKLIKGDLDPQKTLSGPIGIAQHFGGEFDALNFWTLVGLLSLVLAFMNILPIPALDGGHALFLLVEMVKGKPLSDKFLERAQIVGFVILLALMVFAFGNDIFKLIKE